MEQRSYGSYQQQQPMKIFAGQPNFATEAQVQNLQNQIDAMACNRCPKSAEQCQNLQDENQKQHCMEMLAQCQAHHCNAD